MRKRVAGATILVAVGIGIWLSNLFNGLGPGGAGTNIGMNPETMVSLDSGTIAGGTGNAGSHAEEPAAPAIPTVVIDERDFYLEQSAGDETKLIPTDAAQKAQLIPTDVRHIVTLVQQTEPNSDGIRIQIKRRRSSRPSAETALDNALHQAGITEEQILRHSGFVD